MSFCTESTSNNSTVGKPLWPTNKYVVIITTVHIIIAMTLNPGMIAIIIRVYGPVLNFTNLSDISIKTYAVIAIQRYVVMKKSINTPGQNRTVTDWLKANCSSFELRERVEYYYGSCW